MIVEAGIIAFIWGLLYSLRETEIWSRPWSPRIFRTDWFLNKTKRLPSWTFQLPKDSYHLFGNILSIYLCIRIGIYYESYEVALGLLVLRFGGMILMRWIIRGGI